MKIINAIVGYNFFYKEEKKIYFFLNLRVYFVILIIHFCHNRALQFKIFIRIVTGCCSQQDLSLRQPHRFQNEPDVQPVQRVRMEG
jgi:hypothetical protein